MTSLTLTPGSKAPDEINVFVEICTGSQNKYEYNLEHGVLTLDRVLYSPMFYPGEYGFVPQTLGPDGDPLDAIVLVTQPTQPGIVIPSRPIGLLKMIDKGEPDDKVLCVPTVDPRWKHVTQLEHIPEPVRDEIAHFFARYKDLEKKVVEIAGWEGAEAAKALVIQSIEAYKAKA
jgi:inorganic pyrophosphatase